MSPPSVWIQAAIVALTLVAITLGGTVDLWAQTIVAAAAGLLIFIAPPRGALPRTAFLLAGLFLLLALAAFLPAPSIHGTPWRQHLALDAHIPPMATRTPQPWLTAQACGLLLVGLVWTLYLFQQPWDKESRVRVAMGLVFGVAILAAIAAAAFVVGFRIPGWMQEENRGWFPNRNQTADVLALVGVINYALISDRLRKGRRSGYLLLLTLVPIGIELVISYSRAGILLFFGGLLLWQVWPRPGKGRGGSIKWAVLSAALALILLAIFLTWGGDTLSRFENLGGPGSIDFTDFRSAIQKDAFLFSLQSPLLGVGLGNFEPLFAFSQIDSINGNRAVHPESDWLWMICEMGWLAPLLLVVAVVWWTRRCFPLEHKPGESMRCAFIVSIFVFLVHGFIDVSGHRIGSLWVALLLASLALPSPKKIDPSRWTPLVFRGLGGVVLLIALWWLGSLLGAGVPPTTATLVRLNHELLASTASAPEIEKKIRVGLRVAPLDWNPYFRLGAIEAFQPDGVARAQANFQTARALNPYWPELLLDEGQVWITADEPDLCLDAWRDGLQHAGPQATIAFKKMIDLVPLHSIEREGLAEVAFDRVDFLLLILPTSPAAEAEALLSHLLKNDPQLEQLSGDQRDQLFAAWWTQGDQVRLMEMLNDHLEWKSETWLYQARFAAKENNYQQACEIVKRWAQPPPIPTSTSDESLADLEQNYRNNPDKLTSGLVLYFAQMKEGKTDDALFTLHSLLKLRNHPAYLAYLEAQNEEGKQDWVSAWEAWEIFLAP